MQTEPGWNWHAFHSLILNIRCWRKCFNRDCVVWRTTTWTSPRPPWLQRARAPQTPWVSSSLTLWGWRSTAALWEESSSLTCPSSSCTPLPVSLASRIKGERTQRSYCRLCDNTPQGWVFSSNFYLDQTGIIWPTTIVRIPINLEKF